MDPHGLGSNHLWYILLDLLSWQLNRLMDSIKIGIYHQWIWILPWFTRSCAYDFLQISHENIEKIECIFVAVGGASSLEKPVIIKKKSLWNTFKSNSLFIFYKGMLRWLKLHQKERQCPGVYPDGPKRLKNCLWQWCYEMIYNDWWILLTKDQ